MKDGSAKVKENVKAEFYYVPASPGLRFKKGYPQQTIKERLFNPEKYGPTPYDDYECVIGVESNPLTSMIDGKEMRLMSGRKKILLIG